MFHANAPCPGRLPPTRARQPCDAAKSLPPDCPSDAAHSPAPPAQRERLQSPPHRDTGPDPDSYPASRESRYVAQIPPPATVSPAPNQPLPAKEDAADTLHSVSGHNTHTRSPWSAAPVSSAPHPCLLQGSSDA